MNEITPSIFLFSLLAAVIPTAFFVTLIYWADRYEKEPIWLLAAVFLWGAVPSIIIAYIFNTLFSAPIYLLAGDGAAADMMSAAFIAPVVEETVKGFALLIIFWLRREEIDSWLDGIIYGAMVGLGFALVENIYYFIGQYQDGGLNAWSVNVFMRSIIFGLNHALFTSMAGLGLAAGYLSTNKFVRMTAPVMGWGAAVFLHFWHNLTVSLGGGFILAALLFDWGGVWLILGIMVWALVQEGRWLKRYLAEEVHQGTLTAAQYKLACSSRRRFGFIYGRFFSHGFHSSRAASRFFYECSHLAYKKHHFALFNDAKTARLIQQSREKIGRLSQNI
ncbi:MAG TPA: PrsW family intramembrane metalloprotease [Anaerolineae bacterium]|nr:PrsW family intramembrane metalloprotease [Anaerolineae bacterium]